MNIKSCLVLAIVICAVHQISANHHGIDVCSSCKKGGITAPRPYPIQLPRFQKPLFKSICKEHSSPSQPKPFKPIGDACHCGQQIVKPAPLPHFKPSHHHQKPCFSLPKLPCPCKSWTGGEKEQEHSENCGHAIRAPDHFQNFGNDGATIYFETSNKKKSPAQPKPRYQPADVVSIAIAKRLAHSAKNGISERNLQYGSLKEPTVEQIEKKKQSSVNEESFYDTKGSILEIQPYIFKNKRVSSEEESEEEVKPKKSHAFHPAHLDFEAIGYKPYEASKPRYVVVKNSQPLKHECTKRPHKHRHHHHHKKDESCDCCKDLVVDQSAVSEQSMSFESPNGRFST